MMHDPDMKWNAFSSKVSGNGTSSVNVNYNANGSSLRTARPEHNPMNLIPGGGSVEAARRNKYTYADQHPDLNIDLLKTRRVAG